jgi:hypothetical protein
VLARAVLFLLAILAGACERRVATPLPQRGYLWQRDWTPAVSAGFSEADARLDGVIILGAQINWRGPRPETLWPNIDWPRLARATKPCAIGIRVSPYSGSFAADDAATRAITDAARTLLERAKANGVHPSELQLDFDCPDKKLAGYRVWVRAVRAAIRPTRLVLTALPSWLNESELPALLREADGYVLQVHSVPTRREIGRTTLCEPALARQWVDRAARLHRPFSVALPTYRALAGFDPITGRLSGNAMDSVQPVWPPGTQVVELSSDANALATLVREWHGSHPPELRELIWYRVPVATDAFNWRWPTLAAVAAGRPPARKFEVLFTGESPRDLALQNAGETDEPLSGPVTLRWEGEPAQAADALAGWELDLQPNSATFSLAPGSHPRLAPGAKLSLGWLRHEHPTPLHPEPVR